ncbi:MAG: ribonuclease E/G, partial [Deltaproteobacteria bacterium]|nr:ribonuclease E/G [Deltaproteobacteria bacterium]
AISRRISSEKERRRLREIVLGLRQPGQGFIIRTVCEGMKREDVEADMDFLVKLWKRILRTREKAPVPGLLYEELDLTLRTIRDLFSPEADRLVVDSKEEYERAKAFVAEFMPGLLGKVELYQGPDDMFDANGIEIELAGALEKGRGSAPAGISS